MRFPRSTARLGARTNTGIAGQVHRSPNYGTQREARRAFLECAEPLVHPRRPPVRLQSRFPRLSRSRTSGPSNGMMKATGVMTRVFAGALAPRRSKDAHLFKSDFAECHHTVRDQVNNMDAVAYFTLLAQLMKTNPPTAADEPKIARFARIGLVPGRDFDASKLDADFVKHIPRVGYDRIMLQMET